MIEIKQGQLWKDLDRRTRGRVRVVVMVVDQKAFMGNPDDPKAPRTWVSVDRFRKPYFEFVGYKTVLNVELV